MDFKEFLKEGSYPYIGKVDNKEYSTMLDYLVKKIETLKELEIKAKSRREQSENMLKHITSAIGSGADDKVIKDSFKKFKKVLDGYN